MSTLTATYPVLHPPPRLLPGSAAFREALRPRSGHRRAAPGARQAVRVLPTTLLQVLNRELATRPECESVRLGARNWVMDRGATGCNWSETSLIVRVHGTTRPGAFAALREVIANVRARYDLLAPTD